MLFFAIAVSKKSVAEAEEGLAWELELMGDLQWLPKYSGESLDQLLALTGQYRVDSILETIEMVIVHKAIRAGAEALAHEEEQILAVAALDREVQDGGYAQFFLNYSARYVPIIVRTLEQIGCPAIAEITARAIAALGTKDLALETLSDAVATANQTLENELTECDRLYFKSQEDITGRLFEFIQANAKNIHL